MKTVDWSKTESFNNPNSEGAAETKWVDPDKDGPIVFNKGGLKRKARPTLQAHSSTTESW